MFEKSFGIFDAHMSLENKSESKSWHSKVIIYKSVKTSHIYNHLELQKIELHSEISKLALDKLDQTLQAVQRRLCGINLLKLIYLALSTATVS